MGATAVMGGEGDGDDCDGDDGGRAEVMCCREVGWMGLEGWMDGCGWKGISAFCTFRRVVPSFGVTLPWSGKRQYSATTQHE